MKLDASSIIVLGGSFNPPTRAHAALLVHALNCTGAGTGIFVPSSDTYVGRKVKRAGQPFLFSEKARLEMLKAICETDRRFKVDTCEYGDTSKGRTLKTLREIQAKYPDKKVCFLTGSDKLAQMGTWKTAKDLLTEFPIVVLARESDDVDAIIDEGENLSAHRDTLILIPNLPSAGGISSSRFQDLWDTDKAHAMSMLYLKVIELVEEYVEEARVT